MTLLAGLRRRLRERWRRFRAPRRARRHQRRLAHRRRVAEAVAGRYGMRVRAGPFAGMLYPWLQAAGSQLTPKLLGTYEREVHAFLERILPRAYGRVVNIGCGEGYYAVGLALRLPGATVFAYDLDPEARRLCAEMAAANQVADRVRIAGACELETLRNATREPALVVCDCEGAELDLLRPDRVPGLRDCDILVEVHRVPGVRSTAEVLRARFSDSHTASGVRYRGRTGRGEPALRFLPWRDRRVAVDERRKRGREWMLLEARRSAPPG